VRSHSASSSREPVLTSRAVPDHAFAAAAISGAHNGPGTHSRAPMTHHHRILRSLDRLLEHVRPSRRRQQRFICRRPLHLPAPASSHRRDRRRDRPPLSQRMRPARSRRHRRGRSHATILNTSWRVTTPASSKPRGATEGGRGHRTGTLRGARVRRARLSCPRIALSVGTGSVKLLLLPRSAAPGERVVCLAAAGRPREQSAQSARIRRKRNSAQRSRDYRLA
jgi:hypothetical protein